MPYLILAGIAATLALVVTPVVGVLATRIGAVDEPGPRRVHATAVPRLGGVALLIAGSATLCLAPLLGVPVMATLQEYGWDLPWLLAGVIAITVGGTLDDVRGLTPLAKLGWQIAAAGLAIAGGYGLSQITNPFTGGMADLGALATVASLLWILLIINALNLIDGLDGLAAGVALIATITLFAVSLVEGRPGAGCLWATLGGALVGFLRYNFNPASIFLGDSGSMLLGFLLAVLSLQSFAKTAVAVVVTVPILALGLPIIEVGVTLLRRTLASGITSIARADREHIHHRLLGQGVSPRGVVLILYSLCATLGGLAFLALVVRGPANAIIVGLGAVLMWLSIRAAGYGGTRRRDLDR